MMDRRPNPQGEEPRSEPEIILPEEALRSSRMRSYVDTHGIQRIYIAKFGPFGIMLVALAIGILLAVLLVFLLGAFLFLIPVVGFLVGAAIISGVFRSHFQRLP